MATRPFKPTPSSDQHRTRQQVKARTAALFCLLVLWGLWIVENLVAEKNTLAVVLTYVPQFPFLLFPLVLLGLALMRREWQAVGLNLAGIAFWLVWGMGLVLPLRWPASAPQRYARLKVMSFNVLGGRWGVERVVQVVKRENPDVVCFQESLIAGGAPLAQLRVALAGYYVAHAREVTTFSRFPFEAQKSVTLPAATGRAFLVTVLKVPSRTNAGQFHRVRVVNVHFTAVQISGFRQGVGRYARQIHQGVRLREQQRAILVRVAGDNPNTPEGLLIMGDFNTPPRGRLYRDLASRWQDAFRSGGSGLGHTFSSRWPVVRIDYVWANAKFAVYHCAPVDPVGVSRKGQLGRASDHRPLVAELDLLP